MDLQERLRALKDEYFRQRLDEVGVLRAMENVLAFLVQPENNTDANCRLANSFVLVEMDVVRSILDPPTPDDLGRILYDMLILHDTHTAPDVAKSFQGTPEILLARTRDLLAKLDPHAP